MEGYNLLVTYHPNQAGLAEREVRRCVENAGEEVEELESSCVNGVLCARVTGDPKRVVADIHEEFREDPNILAHTYHWVPVERWVKATVEDMTEATRSLAEGIGDDERWMMHMHKRHHAMSSEEMVLALTDPLKKGRVDLKNPQKIIAVEVLGAMAAMALVTPEEIVNTNRMRQEIGLQRMR